MSPLDVSRRRFLGFATGAVAGTAAGVPASRTLSDWVAATDQEIRPPSGPEDSVLSVCKLCPGGCGLRVRRIDGRPVKVDGNPHHPVSGGRLCPKGQAALQSLFHPDRLMSPMRRVGPVGSIESFEPRSWEEALAEIAERLKLLHQVGRPESLAILRGCRRGVDARVARRFLEAFGSPNDIVLDRGEEAATLALYLTQGVRAAPAYDVQSTDYVLSFGAALLEASSSPVHMMRAYGEFRQGRPGRRGKLVQIEPRLSVTASSADEWIGIRPETEGILALGIAQVLVSEGLYDRDFVSERSVGFFEPLEGSSARESLGEFLRRHYGLEEVAEKTGVSNNVILRIAREFAGARTRLAVGPRKGPLLPGSLFDHLAVQTLNALVGNPDRAGGVLVPEDAPLAAWPQLPEDEAAAAGRARPRLDLAGGNSGLSLTDPEGLAELVLSGGFYPLELAFLLETDPVLTSMAVERFEQAIQKIPLVVCFASVPTDTALFGDWILPQTHFLERWDLETGPPGVPFPLVSLAQPVWSDADSTARSAADVLVELAGEVGGTVASAFPWSDVPSLIRAEVEGLFDSRRGALIGTEFDEAWVRMMERAGWWAPGYRTAEEMWRGIRQSGGWWDPFYDHGNWRRVLRTESGRFEFRGDLLRELGDGRKRPYELAAAGGEAETLGESPLLALVLFEPLPVAGGVGAELPFLMELLEPGLEESWTTWAEIHPETAEHIGIRDHDPIRLTSDQGSIEAKARVTTRIVEGAVAVPVGLGKIGGGRWAS
ncbi:MAG: molybdopterin-dependent oxidoreductase, partial [Acidobacteriota bacterium]|nr:molybdopterin-dependent oxidoreductase [Acidobacteriota bacterium]